MREIWNDTPTSTQIRMKVVGRNENGGVYILCS
jgi:hypothetical protein